MIKFVLAFAVTLALSGAALAADGYTLDAKGKCHGADGKFAKQAMCATTAPHSYKLDAKGKCHDETGKFAKAGMCKA